MICMMKSPNPDWSRTYSRQPEIRDYLQRTADEFGIRPHVRFGCDVIGASWDEQDGTRSAVETWLEGAGIPTFTEVTKAPAL